jgi:fumarate reductase flavoprotein subunit
MAEAIGGGDSALVVVVGAGGCGMVAALAAAEGGARVLLLEKTDIPGGNTALTTSLVVAGSRFQREEGIEDDPETFIADITRRNGGQASPGLVKLMAQQGAPVLEWLADRTGIEFTVAQGASGHSQRRAHSCGGGWAFVRELISTVTKHPNIEVRWSTSVRSIVMDSAGAVTGVRTDEGVITAGKVILATGGFGANKEMVAHYIPKADGIPYRGHPGVAGDSVRMGLAAGGVVANMDAFLPYPTYFRPLQLPMPQPLIHNGAILVGEDGRRFVDETRYPSGPGAAMLDMQGKCAYEIFDARIRQEVASELAPVIARQAFVTGPSSDELAVKLGIDPQGLSESIEEYNAAASGEADRFGRTPQALLSAPFYGAQVWVSLYNTQGGLRVNENGQALKVAGTTIPNLYAGGDASEGISGPGATGYLPGNGTLTAIVLGKVAGEHAARSLQD